MNKQRGDVAVTLDGRECVLRPTFDALVEIEERLGIGLVPLAKRFVAGEFGIREVSVILAAGLRGAGQKVPEDLGNKIVKAGVLSFTQALVQLLTNALQGDSEGNAEAATGEVQRFPGAATGN